MNDANVKPGYWLDLWQEEYSEKPAAWIRFAPEVHMAFPTEERAKEVSEQLRAQRIETEVVKIR